MSAAAPGVSSSPPGAFTGVKMKRITLQIGDDEFEKLKAKVPHGFRGHLLKALLKLVLDAMEKDSAEAVAGAIISGRFQLVENGE